MEKRLILAITLSILIIVSFQYYVSKNYPSTPQVANTQQLTQASDERRASAKQSEASPKGTSDERRTERSQEAAIIAPQPNSIKEETHTAETDEYELVFSNVGGALKEIRIKDYKARGGEGYLELASVRLPQNYIFAMDDPLNRIPLNGVYELTKKDGSVIYTMKSGPIEVVKKYILHNSKHTIALQLTIKNRSDQEQELVYRIIAGAGVVEPDPQDKRLISAMAKIDGKVSTLKHPKEKRITSTGAISWVALKNKYFSMIMKPIAQTKTQFYEAPGGDLVTGIEVQGFTLPPRSFIQHDYLFYAGPSDIKVLEALGVGFEESIDYGMFGSISVALLWVMKTAYKIFHNWGISIIVLAVLLNIILFPLTMKSFKSMQKMHALQPQMEKVKAECKDNPQKLNKEIMELYKKNKINPFSGCLPLLLQMPIFIALYQALSRSVDLKNASFLWIKDLSLPDGVRLPLTLPVIGNSINILPILMAVAMVVQQKMSGTAMGAAQTDEQKQQQKIMLIMMPVMFGFIFYNMPSGLVLYWLLNTVFTVAEQMIVFKKAK